MVGRALSKSFYMLGQVFEKTGDKIKAIENYAKFLTFGKTPTVAARGRDAKKRLAG